MNFDILVVDKNHIFSERNYIEFNYNFTDRRSPHINSYVDSEEDAPSYVIRNPYAVVVKVFVVVDLLFLS